MFPSCSTVEHTFNMPKRNATLHVKQRKKKKKIECSFIICKVLLNTYSFLLIEAQDLHGLQSLNQHLIILLVLYLHVPSHQETIVTKVF